MNDANNDIIEAINNDDVDSLKFFVFKNNKILNSTINIDGDTPLILSARRKSQKCIDYLLENCDKELKNFSGESYLDFYDKKSNEEYKEIIKVVEVSKDKKYLDPYIIINNKKTDTFKL